IDQRERETKIVAGQLLDRAKLGRESQSESAPVDRQLDTSEASGARGHQCLRRMATLGLPGLSLRSHDRATEFFGPLDQRAFVWRAIFVNLANDGVAVHRGTFLDNSAADSRTTTDIRRCQLTCAVCD